jgi:soluble lytic murein transglycosylase-like protein
VKGILGVIIGGLLLAAPYAWTENGTAATAGDSAAQQAPAPQSSIKIFKYRNRSGVTSFSDRAPPDTRYEVIKYTSSCYACNPRSKVDWYNVPLQLVAFQDTISNVSRKYDVDPALVRAVIHAESAFRPRVVSKKGAIGLMQLMPDTAKDMGVVDAMSPDENIQGGVRYLAWLLQTNGGNTTLATAAYNAGPGAVERFNGIPPYEETKTYVKRVRILHDRYRTALASTYSGKQLSQTTSY